jgi:hypothetical protein
MLQKISSFILAAFVCTQVLAQSVAYDTVTVMHYNLMQFNVANPPSCTPPAVSARLLNITTIFGYVKPDIFSVNEMNRDAVTADRILAAVTTAGYGNFQRAALNFGNQSDVLSNMIYYNTQKLSLTVNTIIGCSPRTANIYQFKHKGTVSGANITGSDVLMTFVVVHLKAGNTPTDNEQKATCVQNIMDYLNQNYDKSGNYFVQGDFNLYTSSESAFTNFTASNPISFRDPINRIGSWSNNGTFADIHTQSTRLSGSECFAGGGMDDRFDFILANQAVLNDSFYVKYIPNSYKTIGQNGTALNSDVNSANNTADVAYIREALYGTSDHLPVSLKLRITLSTVPSYLIYHDSSKIPSTIKGTGGFGSNNSLVINGLYHTLSGVVLPTQSLTTVAGTFFYLTTSGGVNSYLATVIGSVFVSGNSVSFSVLRSITAIGISMGDMNTLSGAVIANPFSASVITSGSNITLTSSLSTITGTYKFSSGTSRITLTGVNTYQNSLGGYDFYNVTLIGSSTFTGSGLTINYEQIFTTSGNNTSLEKGKHLEKDIVTNNPFDEFIGIDVPYSGNYKISLYDLSGVEILQCHKIIRDNELIQISTVQIKNGMYILKIESESKIWTRKVVKNA